MDSVLDMLSACNLAILSNALDFRTYTHPKQVDDETLNDEHKMQMDVYDRNSLSDADRTGCVYARGLALDLFNWFADNYVLKDESRNESMSTLLALMNNLAHQAYSVWVTKEQAMALGIGGAPNCTMEGLHQQLTNALPEAACEIFEKLLENKVKIEKMHLDWTGWIIEPIDKPNAPNAPGSTQYTYDREKIWSLGLTPFDEKYAKGAVVDFAVNFSDDPGEFS